MHDSHIEDARATDPVQRLLEDSWSSRAQRANRRELTAEAAAAGLFFAAAGPLAATALGGTDLGLAVLLTALYALIAGSLRFPLGAGYVVPSYVVLAPMLLLLPPATVPLFIAIALLLASTVRWAARRGPVEQILFSVPNAWHALGPALVLTLARPGHGGLGEIGVYVVAFVAGCVIDLGTSALRESCALGVAPNLQLRVAALVWLIDACIAPLGLLLGELARHDHSRLLVLLPLTALLWLLERDRSARIAQAQHRLDLVRRERTRLQAAVQRLGDALAAKLELPALTSIVLQGSVEALAADAGRLTLELPRNGELVDSAGDSRLAVLLEAAGRQALASAGPGQVHRDGVWALALPLGPIGDHAGGVLAVARREREFRPDEQALMLGLVERAHTAVAEILANEAIRQEAITDPLTLLGNRRRLTADLTQRLAAGSEPLILMLFDLDGFKSYNDTFGHLAGDALLARLGGKLKASVPDGTAYRLGGDEFCVLAPAQREELHSVIARAARALSESGERFSVTASCGAVLLPHEATTPDYALQLADERMYSRKRSRPSAVREQTRDVLVRIMQAKQPSLPDHSTGVASLALAVGRRLGMRGEQLDELARAAELHDIGKVGIPDAILDKPDKLNAQEWEFVRQHTILGERILSAAPALRPVAKIVRASHERWDGRGYPDRLSGHEIPLAARVVAVCDAYEAITGERCYRPARSAEVAREELLREAGHQFDPAVVAAFLDELDDPQGHIAAVDTDGEQAAWQLAGELAGRLAEMLDPSL
jgi:diguanylate cyclase (GGDEF)-like protein